MLIIVLAIGLQRLLSWFADYGEGWAEAMLGPASTRRSMRWPGSSRSRPRFGVVLGGIFLMPAVTSLVAGFFVDDIGDLVEREYYPAEQPGVALPLSVAIIEGVKIALLTILVYLVALPFVLVAGAGFLIFFIATAWLQGKQYFELAAMRFRPPAEAKAMRKYHAATIFTAGSVHRGLRLDPDRQSGDAAVRHGLHGPHAQAIVGPAARIDRAETAQGSVPTV